MPDLPSTLPDREFQKFTIDADGQTSVRIDPGAVTDSDGNELDIDEAGRARMLDTKTHDELKSINSTLKEVLFQLKLITGA